MNSSEKDLLKWLENRNEAAQARVYRKFLLWRLKNVHNLQEDSAVYIKVLGPNGVLSTHPTEDLRDAFRDGTLLIRLAEIFSGRAIVNSGYSKWFENPSNSEECVQNLTVGLSHFGSDGAGVAGYDANVIHVGTKMKELLAVLWTIILRYQVGVGQDTLLKFCAECCVSQNVTITDLRDSWLDGRAFGAIASHFKPGLFPEGVLAVKGKIRKDEALNKAFAAAEELGIPPLLDANSDLGDHTPDRIIVLYTSLFYDTFGPPSIQRALQKKAKELERSLVERERQLAQSATELRYLVTNHNEVRSLLEEQRTSMQEANRKVMELSLKLPFFTGGNFRQRVPAPDEGNITLVMTAVHNSNILWDVAPEAMAQGLKLHNMLMLDAIEEFQGYGAGMEGGNFTIAFSDPINAFRFTNRIQHDLLHADWPEELLRVPEAAPEIVDSVDEKGNAIQKPIFRGLRIKIAIHHGEPLCNQDAFGRATYAGPEVSLASSLLCVANPGQTVVTGVALQAIREELGEENPISGEGENHIVSLGADEHVSYSQVIQAHSLGEVKISSEESTVVYSAVASDLLERCSSFTELNLENHEPIDVRQVLLGKVEELQLQNQKLKDKLSEMELKASTATKRANELQSWLSSCVDTPSATTEESLKTALSNLKKIMEEHSELKDTLGLVRRQNDSLQEYAKRMATELRDSTFDVQLTSTKLNQMTRLHQSCPSTIHALRKERDALLKKLGKNKGFLNKIMTKVGIKKEDKEVIPSAGEESVKEDARSGDTATSIEGETPSTPTTSEPKTEGSTENTPDNDTAQAEGTKSVSAEHPVALEGEPKVEGEAVAPATTEPNSGEPAASGEVKEKRLHRSRSGRNSSKKLRGEISTGEKSSGEKSSGKKDKKHRSGDKSERSGDKAEREKDRTERRKRKAEKAEKKRLAEEASAAAPAETPAS